MGTLAGKVAVVTGGGGALGRASALAMAESGARIAVLDRNLEAARATVAAVASSGGDSEAVEIDLANENSIESAIARVVACFDGIDIVHNNAAEMSPEVLGKDRTVLELDPSLFSRVFAVNVIGYALMAKYAIPQMIPRGGGVIINMSSVTGHAAEMGRIMYGTTKSAILGLTRNIATQHGKDGIRCVSISPGVIVTPGIAEHMSQAEIDMYTEHNAVSRSGQPEDIGNLVAYLASDKAGFISGTDILIDGGILAHFPTVVDEKRFAARALLNKAPHS